ncbi:DUF2561 family protein [Mycobacterium sp. AMU20-3851]|uniref:DUF2561 family protein n=1 Tax=Mycobacterium sp. AMU20-3851 TaxID=3122055 RepID=UPI003754326D
MLKDTEPTRRTLSGPDNLERILLGACAAIWLLALGAAVAATVALVDLANGRGTVRAEISEASGSETPWVLYTVIGVSAAVIVIAIPLLVRARRQGGHRSIRDYTPAGGSVAEDIAAVPTRAERRRQETARSVGDAGGLGARGAALVDQVYVRCALSIACAVGAGVLAVGAATYLMATDSGGAAIAFYIIAGIVTVAMPVLPWFYLRELRAVTGAN